MDNSLTLHFHEMELFSLSGKRDSAKRDSAKRDSAKREATVLVGNGHFWTAGNEKPQNQSSPNFAQVITSLFFNVCTHFGSNRLSGDFSAHA